MYKKFCFQMYKKFCFQMYKKFCKSLEKSRRASSTSYLEEHCLSITWLNHEISYFF